MRKLTRQKSLRFLVLLLVSVTFTIFAAILFALFHSTMPKMLLEAENRYHLQQQKVVAGLFDAALRDTYLLAEDTAAWRETVRFVLGTNPDYLLKNWSGTTLLQSFRQNYVLFLNSAGETVYSDFYDYLQDRPLDEPEGLEQALSAAARDVLRQPALLHPQGRRGIILHEGSAYSVAIAPVCLDYKPGDVYGVLILGNFLNNA